LEVAGVEDVLRLLRVVRPDGRVEVRLQLHPDGEAVEGDGRQRPPLTVEPVGPAEEVLDVVPDLVRDHVRLGEVAWRLEAARELREEAQSKYTLRSPGQ